MTYLNKTKIKFVFHLKKYGRLYQKPRPVSTLHPRHSLNFDNPIEPIQDFSKIPGTPGVDFPIFHSVPETNFHCGNVPAIPGMYANIETGCQAYHICHDGREGHQGASFLCANGTIFNQKEFNCDWWYNVRCEESSRYYDLNADPKHNPFTPKKKLDKFVIDI